MPWQLIGEVDGNSELEHVRIHRVVRQCKIIVAAEQAFVGVRIQNEESHHFQFTIDIGIHKRIVSYFRFVLCMEYHGCRLVCQTFVRGIIVAIDSKLHLRYFGYREQKIHAAGETKLGQRNYRRFAAFLIGDFVIEIEDAEFQILFERCAEHLDKFIFLCRYTVIVEVNVVLQVFHSDIQVGAPTLDRQPSAQSDFSDLSEMYAR